jgi:hypothetical protein
MSYIVLKLKKKKRISNGVSKFRLYRCLIINRFVPPSSPKKLVCKWVNEMIPACHLSMRSVCKTTGHIGSEVHWTNMLRIMLVACFSRCQVIVLALSDPSEAQNLCHWWWECFNFSVQEAISTVELENVCLSSGLWTDLLTDGFYQGCLLLFVTCQWDQIIGTWQYLLVTMVSLDVTCFLTALMCSF